MNDAYENINIKTYKREYRIIINYEKNRLLKAIELSFCWTLLELQYFYK